MLDRALGMDDALFAQVVSGRDPIQLQIILKIQEVLGVNIITEKYLTAVFKSYVKHIYKLAKGEA